MLANAVLYIAIPVAAILVLMFLWGLMKAAGDADERAERDYLRREREKRTPSRDPN